MKIKRIGAALLSLLFVGTLCGCNSANKSDSAVTVSLNDYVEITVSGQNGEGVAKYEIDTESFIEDYVNKIKPSMEYEKEYSKNKIPELLLKKCVDGKLSETKNLSNGDEITFEWDCDDETANESFHVTLEYSSIDYKVKGLSSDEEPEVSEVESSAASENVDSFDSDLSYIRSADEIPPEDLNQIDAMFRQHIKEINFDSDKEVADEIILTEVHVLYSETQTPCNRVYFIYRIKAHNTQQSGYFYWYGGYDNIRCVNDELVYPDYYFEVKDKVNGLVFDGDTDTGYWYYGIPTPDLLYQSEVGDMEKRGYELETRQIDMATSGQLYSYQSN